MKKRRILASVLAALTALTVTACGSVDSSTKDTNDEKTNVLREDENDVKDAVKKVGDRVEDTGKTISAALSGELDFAYAGTATLTFGEGLTDEIGTALKPITVTAGTKQKGQKTQADISVAYDSGTLVTLNTVADNEAEIVYVKIPELSDAYIAITPDELKNMLGDEFGLNEDLTELGDGITLDGIEDFLADIDFDALYDDFEEYCQLIEDKIPEGTDGGRLTGDINGHSYDYEVVSYDVKGQVVYDIADAVTQKAKDDQLLKDLFAKFGITGDEYDSTIEEFTAELKSAEQDDLDKTAFVLDVYKDGDEVYGFNFFIPEDNESVKLVTIADDSTLGIDFSATDDGVETASAKGAFTDDNGTVNGSLAISAEGTSALIEAEDLKAEGDLFSGKITAAIDADGENFVGSLVSASTEDKLDITVTADMNGKNLFVLTLNGEETDASDITLPSGTIYNFNEDDLNAYASSCDLEGFLARLEDIFGDGLTEQFA